MLTSFNPGHQMLNIYNYLALQREGLLKMRSIVSKHRPRRHPPIE
jgi:hypothetical protein